MDRRRDHIHNRLPNDLVLQCGDPERSCPAVRPGNLHAPDRRRPVCPPLCRRRCKSSRRLSRPSPYIRHVTPSTPEAASFFSPKRAASSASGVMRWKSAPGRPFLFPCAAFRIRLAARDTLSRHRVRRVPRQAAFPPAGALSSGNSAEARAPLFAAVKGRMTPSDFFEPFITGFGFLRSPCGPGTPRSADISPTMAMSAMQPSASTKASAPRKSLFAAQQPCPFVPPPTLRLPLREGRRAARGETWIGCSSATGTFHPPPFRQVAWRSTNNVTESNGFHPAAPGNNTRCLHQPHGAWRVANRPVMQTGPRSYGKHTHRNSLRKIPEGVDIGPGCDNRRPATQSGLRPSSTIVSCQIRPSPGLY